MKTKAAILAALYLTLLEFSCAFFSASRQAQRQQTARHYFDDLSRYSVEWEPSRFDNDDSAAAAAALQKRADAKAAIEKREALQRILGYNAASASQLSCAEIRALTKAWMRKSGAVQGRTPTIEGDELYHKLVGMKVCKSDTIIGCLSYYWKMIVKVIREEDEDPISSRRSKEGVYMVLFPYCKDLYMYDKLSMMNSAVDLGQDLCQHLGLDFSLTMFHPKYKNAPRMFSPARHSPFPTAGVQFSRSKKVDQVFAPEDSTLVVTHRIHLERLFNSAAASKSLVTAAESQVASLPYYSRDEVVKRSREWFEKGAQNGKYGETPDNRWLVSTATIAEEAYADVWSMIHHLTQQQQQRRNDGNEPVILSSVLVAPRFKTFSAPQWLKFAVTVNAVLKRMTDGKISLEVFHPEYTGSNHDNLRRSPFPTMHISCKA